MKLAIVKAIGEVEDATCREVLELYYLDGLTWEQVAARMHYSVRNVQIINGRALEMVRVPEEEGEDSLH